MFDERLVHELAARRGDPVMTSFYLDVDGHRYASAAHYHPYVTHLRHAARTRAARLGGAAEAAVEADLDQICRWIDDGIDRTTTRGIVVFSCTAQGYFQPVLLPVPVRDQVSVEPCPNVTQLLAILEHRRRTLVVLVDRRQGRIMREELGAIGDRPGILDEPERQVDTDVELGGWDHRHEEAARRHFRRIAARLSAEVRAWHPDGVIISGSSDDVAGLEACIDNLVADLVVGVVKLPIRVLNEDVAAVVLTIARDLAERREQALVDELHERASQGHKAVLGPPAVLAVLAERRVETLVVARGFRTPGTQCPACGHLGLAAGPCPECGTPSTEFDDIVDLAIDQALAQDAAVEFCEDTELAFFGGVGALERF